MTPVPYIIVNLTIWPINTRLLLTTSQNKRKCNKSITAWLDLVSCKTSGVHLLNIYEPPRNLSIFTNLENMFVQ